MGEVEGFGRVWVGLEGLGSIWECQNYGTVAKKQLFGRVREGLGTFKNAKSVYLSAKRATTTIHPDLPVHRFTIGILKF